MKSWWCRSTNRFLLFTIKKVLTIIKLSGNKKSESFYKMFFSENRRGICS